MFSPFGFMGTQAGGDADATAYINAVITAGGSLSVGEETAIDTFYTGLKSDGIYSKLFQMYTFMGSTASSNAINGINPGTNDLLFSGTWQHSISGSYATKNNANYADTGYNLLTNATDTQNSFSWGVQNNQPGGGGFGYCGAGTGTGNYVVTGFEPTTTDSFYPTGGIKVSGGSPNDMFIGNFCIVSRTGASAWYAAGLAYGNPASGGFNTSAIQTTLYTSPYNGNLHINNINGATYPAGGRYTFTFLGSGLSTGEIDTLLLRVHTLGLSFTDRTMFI